MSALVSGLQAVAQPQTPAAAEPSAPASITATTATSTTAAGSTSISVIATPPSQPRYSAAELARAFAFMDGNKDGKISRDEASSFRGVSRHFDQADTNKDGFLSREEFESAMSQVK